MIAVPSSVVSLLSRMAILALLAAFIGSCRGELVTPNAYACQNVSVIVPTQPRFLSLGVCFVALSAACCIALGPSLETSGTDTMLAAKRPDHADRILSPCADRIPLWGRA